MKQAIQPGRINVPRRPHGRIGMKGVIGCLAECVMAIQQLRDRPVFYNAGVGGGGGSEFEHMWQVTAVANEEDPEIKDYSVKGGIVTIQGTRVVVADAVLPGGNPETVTEAWIYLAVYRDTDSRDYDDTSPPEILYSETELTSDYSAEYTVLAEIEYAEITQCRNDEISSLELMIVENGEFSLIPMQSNSRNSYDLPEPEPEE